MALNTTKGEATANGNGVHVGSTCIATTHNAEYRHHDAHLIADAFNTANKTGLLPSELAERNGKLTYALKMCKRVFKERFGQTIQELDTILIENDTPEPPTTLTLSEADEAMNNGHMVAHERWLHGEFYYKANGVVYTEHNTIASASWSLLQKNEKYQTGWCIVHP